MLKSVETLCMGCFARHEAPVNPCPACGYDETSQAASPHQLRPRTILNGKHLLGKVLGEGGFGITYVGWDLNLDVKIAIKEYYPSGFVTRETTSATTVQPFSGSQGDFFVKGRERFVEEARSLAKFRFLPGIVAVSDFFQENGTAYIVMEYIDGQTMKSYLAQMGGKLPAAQVLDMMKPVMASLAEVHKNGTIHRDISPDNIMISKNGYVKLLDFGAARDFTDSGNKSLSIMLKPGFAPEEQYRSRGIQGPWTDVYALCATMYKCMTGVTPEESLERVGEDTLKPPRQLGAAMTPAQEAALLKGLAVRQKDRYQSVPELFDALFGATPVPALAEIKAPGPVSVSEVKQPGPPQKPFVMNKAVAAVVGGICVIAVAALAVWGLWPSSEDATNPPDDPSLAVVAVPSPSSAQPSPSQPLPSSEEPSTEEPSPSSEQPPSSPEQPSPSPEQPSPSSEEPSPSPEQPSPSPERPSPSPVQPSPSPSPEQPSPSPERPSPSPSPPPVVETITLGGVTFNTDVTTLNLTNKKITDISPLAKCTELTELRLGSNSISDISPLAKCTKLTYLTLGSNSISDISPLAKCTKLTYLTLGTNSITDISVLSNLTNLTTLALYENKITDISPLAKCTELADLRLGSTSISDISVLSNFTNLTTLYLYQNKITDISPLEKCTKLTYLSIWGNSISDISALSNLTNLTTLAVYQNKITDISPLKGLTNLTSLNLGLNPLSEEQIDELKTALPNCDIKL